MNVDLKLGCYYTLSVSFGMTEIKVQDWTLDEAINSLIKKAERNFYSITKEDGVKVNPDSITVTPEYYAFYEDDKSNRCIIDNSDIELYYKPLSPHKMYFHGADSRRPLSQVLLDKGAKCEDPITLTEEQTKKLIVGFFLIFVVFNILSNISIDGHNIEEILAALDEARTVKGKPTVIVAQTVKGKGV